MFLGIRKKYWMILVFSIVLAAVTAFANLSSVFAWQETIISGPLTDNLDDDIGENRKPGENIFRVDKTDMARILLGSDYIEKVDIYSDIPSSIHVEINRFEPIALVMADELFGIDKYGRIIPCDTAWESFSLPVLTGLEKIKLFKQPNDFRASGVASALLHIKKRFEKLYNQIAEIDFSHDIYLEIFLTTGRESYRASSRDLIAQLCKMHLFQQTGLHIEGGRFNLEYDGIVVRDRD